MNVYAKKECESHTSFNNFKFNSAYIQSRRDFSVDSISFNDMTCFAAYFKISQFEYTIS